MATCDLRLCGFLTGISCHKREARGPRDKVSLTNTTKQVLASELGGLAV